MEFIATLPGWAINAMAIGVIGAVAGAIGGVFMHAGHKWGRWLPVVAIALAVTFSREIGLTDWVQRQAITPTSVSTIIKSENPGLYGFLETTFPNDYQQLTAKMADGVKGGASYSAVRSQAATAMTQLRQKYAPMVALASDEDHSEIIELSIAFHRAILTEDPYMCSKVAMSGAMPLIESSGFETAKSMIEPQAIQLFRAAANAMTSPVQRRPATDADWAALGDAMFDRGMTDAQFAAMQSSDINSPDFCPSLLIFMRTLNDVDNEGIKAVRAEFVRDISAS